MKTTKLLSILFGVAVMASGGCVAEDTLEPIPEPLPSCASVPGVARVNIGSTSGGFYSTSIGGDILSFDNRNLNFHSGIGGGPRYIVNVGSGCLASVTTFPTSGPGVAAMILGNNYVLQGGSGSHYKFSADAYSSGSVTISWVRM